MASFNDIQVSFPQPLKDLYKLTETRFGTIDFGGKIMIGIVKFDNVENLSTFWSEVNSYITAYYFSESDSEFAKWNSYLFYLTPSKIEKPLKYDIENNKFSSRKIVIDNFNEELSTKTISDIIESHITCTNMHVKVAPPKIDKFTKNPKFSKIIDQLTIPKKGKEEILKLALIKIEKELRDEV